MCYSTFEKNTTGASEVQIVSDKEKEVISTLEQVQTKIPEKLEFLQGYLQGMIDARETEEKKSA